MRKFIITAAAALTLALSVGASTAQAVTYNTGWVCQYENHPAPVPYANGYLFCFSNYRWWFVGP